MLQDGRRSKVDLSDKFRLIFRTRFDAGPDGVGHVLGANQRPTLKQRKRRMILLSEFFCPKIFVQNFLSKIFCPNFCQKFFVPNIFVRIFLSELLSEFFCPNFFVPIFLFQFFCPNFFVRNTHITNFSRGPGHSA